MSPPGRKGIFSQSGLEDLYPHRPVAANRPTGTVEGCARKRRARIPGKDKQVPESRALRTQSRQAAPTQTKQQAHTGRPSPSGA